MSKLLDNVGADTVGDAFSFKSLGPRALIVRGDDFGGGTVTIEAAAASDATSRWAVIDDGTFTANGTKQINIVIPGMLLRAVLNGATAPVNVLAEVVDIAEEE